MARPGDASDVSLQHSFGFRPSDFGFLHWRSHVDLHHEPPPSQSGVQNWLHLESVASVAGLAPARTGLKGRLLDLLCIHGREEKLQASSLKHQRNSNPQAPSFRSFAAPFEL